MGIQLLHQQGRILLLGASLCLFSLSCSLNPSLPTNTDCGIGPVTLSSDFSGGRMDGCERISPNNYLVTLVPENFPINHSPWYAFKVTADSREKISITLDYTKHSHRYHPKISRDTVSWTTLDKAQIEVSRDRLQATITLDTKLGDTWISAQEIIDNEDNHEWMTGLAEQPFLEVSLLGQSAQGRDIYQIESGSGAKNQTVLLIGRQHPPEITGALAMRPFMERLFEADPLATSFREKYGVLAIPVLNPDGVFLGNWRHNTGGMDLNRDWGPFTQPETMLVRDRLTEFQQPDAPGLALFIDFHSTNKTVFYSIADGLETSLPDFVDEWTAAVQAGALKLENQETVYWQRANDTKEANSKTYFHLNFKIPSLTFELADDSDRGFIHNYARMAAEKMMTLLLQDQS